MKLMSFNTQHCLNYLEQKINYIFVSPDVEIISADIPAIVSADHRPHTAEVIMK